MAKKVTKPPAEPSRKALNVSKVDPIIWERFKKGAEQKGKRLWAYHEEALLEKLERDGY
jgi:hypothetical protein